MEHLEVAKILTDTFKHRTLTHHASEKSVKIIPYGTQQVMLVFDLAVSQEILLSKSFNAFNYFKPGLEHLAEAGIPLSLIGTFYDETALFKEGKEHYDLKKIFHQDLERLCIELQSLQPTVEKYMRKRKHLILNPLDFSNRLVSICFGLLITRLTSIPLRRVLRSLSMRKNVFFHFFHSSRQKNANAALTYLYASSTPPVPGTADWNNHLLAQSLMMMGYDPIVASICASLVDKQTNPLATGVFRYNPVSYVSRICVKPVSIAGIAYNPDDVCYVALAPANDENEESNKSRTPNLAFGGGRHACIGKRLSLAVLEIAEKILLDTFSEGFAQSSMIAPDGAFLAFRSL